jgi:diamine N-acetyltransferase
MGNVERAVPSGRMVLRKTEERDLDAVLKMEADARRDRWVIGWSKKQHRNAMRDPDAEHWVLEDPDTGQPVGYVILQGIQNPHGSIELKRIVVSRPGRGLGKEALRFFIRRCFDELGAHRLWLDVMEHNERARRVYESVGFVREGTLRECLKIGERYVSLHIMSILRHEAKLI